MIVTTPRIEFSTRRIFAPMTDRPTDRKHTILSLYVACRDVCRPVSASPVGRRKEEVRNMHA